MQSVRYDLSRKSVYDSISLRTIEMTFLTEKYESQTLYIFGSFVSEQTKTNFEN